MLECTYFGRLSGVNRMSASPRRIDAPSESAGISDSAGGFHADASNATAALPAAAGTCARSTVHAAAKSASGAPTITTRTACAVIAFRALRMEVPEEFERISG